MVATPAKPKDTSEPPITMQTPDNVIGETLVVQGRIEFQNLLRIDGHFEVIIDLRRMAYAKATNCFFAGINTIEERLSCASSKALFAFSPVYHVSPIHLSLTYRRWSYRGTSQDQVG